MSSLIWLKRPHRVKIYQEIDYAIKFRAADLQEAMIFARERMLTEDHVKVAGCLKHMARLAGSRYESSPFDAMQGFIPDGELIMLRVAGYFDHDLEWIYQLVSSDRLSDMYMRRAKALLARIVPRLADDSLTVHHRLRFYSFLLHLLSSGTRDYLGRLKECLRGIKERRSTRIYFELYRQLSKKGDMLDALTALDSFLPIDEHQAIISSYTSDIDLVGMKQFLRGLYGREGVVSRGLLD